MNSHSDFIVGKQYFIGHNGKIYTCVGHRVDGNAVMEDPYQHVFATECPNIWQEYREPREFWLVPDDMNASVAYYKRNFAESYADLKRVDRANIIHVREVIE